MIEALTGALKSGLSLWESKESRKYIYRVIKLEKEYYEEDNKDRPDMALLDNIEFQLRLISHSFSSQVSKQNLKNI